MPTWWATASREELIKELERQQREIERLRREHERADRDRDRYRRDRDQLRKKIDRLEEDLDKARRALHRQAAPFHAARRAARHGVRAASPAPRMDAGGIVGRPHTSTPRMTHRCHPPVQPAAVPSR